MQRAQFRNTATGNTVIPRYLLTALAVEESHRRSLSGAREGLNPLSAHVGKSKMFSENNNYSESE